MVAVGQYAVVSCDRSRALLVLARKNSSSASHHLTDRENLPGRQSSRRRPWTGTLVVDLAGARFFVPCMEAGRGESEVAENTAKAERRPRPLDDAKERSLVVGIHASLSEIDLQNAQEREDDPQNGGESTNAALETCDLAVQVFGIRTARLGAEDLSAAAP